MSFNEHCGARACGWILRSFSLLRDQAWYHAFSFWVARAKGALHADGGDTHMPLALLTAVRGVPRDEESNIFAEKGFGSQSAWSVNENGESNTLPSSMRSGPPNMPCSLISAMSEGCQAKEMLVGTAQTDKKQKERRPQAGSNRRPQHLSQPLALCSPLEAGRRGEV